MSQRAEKYASNMERRVDKLEERVDRSETMIDMKLHENDSRLADIEGTLDHHRADYANEVEAWRRGEIQADRESRRKQREIERAMVSQRVLLLITMALAVVALITALVFSIDVMDTKRVVEAVKPTAAVTAGMWADLAETEPVESDPWAFVALYRVAEDPLEVERIEEAMLANGYFNLAVPLPFEYQDYMQTYCNLYRCPYPLALAVADWETRGQFNMDAVGPFGEVGIFQLNPGPGGAYHAELEAATGLNPTAPEGNIAGGCYLLGKYMARYEDATKAAMAYNMGQAGAESAWEAGITSTSYTDSVLDAMEMWESTVNAWAGE